MESVLTHAAVILDGEVVRQAPLEEYLGRRTTAPFASAMRRARRAVGAPRCRIRGPVRDSSIDAGARRPRGALVEEGCRASCPGGRVRRPRSRRSSTSAASSTGADRLLPASARSSALLLGGGERQLQNRRRSTPQGVGAILAQRAGFDRLGPAAPRARAPPRERRVACWSAKLNAKTKTQTRFGFFSSSLATTRPRPSSPDADASRPRPDTRPRPRRRAVPLMGPVVTLVIALSDSRRGGRGAPRTVARSADLRRHRREDATRIFAGLRGARRAPPRTPRRAHPNDRRVHATGLLVSSARAAPSSLSPGEPSYDPPLGRVQGGTWRRPLVRVRLPRSDLRPSICSGMAPMASSARRMSDAWPRGARRSTGSSPGHRPGSTRPYWLLVVGPSPRPRVRRRLA